MGGQPVPGRSEDAPTGVGVVRSSASRRLPGTPPLTLAALASPAWPGLRSPAMTPSRHISVSIAAPAAAAYAYAADPAHLPAWAAGLAQSTVEQVDDHWVAESPMGRVRVAFTPANDLGVLDHTVTLPSGEQVLNPLRVIPDGEGCEVVFTVRQRPGLSADDFEGDCRAVLADLETLRSLLEHG